MTYTDSILDGAFIDPPDHIRAAAAERIIAAGGADLLEMLELEGFA